MLFDTDLAPSWREIMRICGVSERTARRWIRSGAPAYAVKLVHLELRGRIMPEKWPQAWRFNERDYLEADSCHPAIGWQQLTWYQYIIQGWYEALATIPEITANIEYLMKHLPQADVIQLEAHRARLEALRARERVTVAEAVKAALASAPALAEKELHRKTGC